MCCNGLVTVILVALLLIRAILTLPTDPSARELMEIRRKKRELRRKAGIDYSQW